MKFEYEWTRDDLKEELINKRFKTNIIFLVVGVLLYFGVMSTGIESEYFDNMIIFIGCIAFVAALVLILFISTKIYIYISLKRNDKKTNEAYGTYKVNFAAKKLEVLINKDKYVYNYKDITKFTKKKNYFFVSTDDDKIGLFFKRKVLGNENYEKALSFLDSKLSC